MAKPQPLILPENPLIKPTPDPAKPIELIYDEKDRQYLSFLQVRLERARIQRQQTWPEYNNKTYMEVWDADEKIANTVLEEKKNDDDVIVSSGTVEAKLDSLLSNIANLDLSPNVLAFDRDNNELDELAVVIEDTIEQSEENDGGLDSGDDEGKLLRQRELLKHGTVWVQEEWMRLFNTKKVLKEKYDGQFLGFKGWDESNEMYYEGPGRTLIHGPNMYLGDMTEYYIEKQPFIFTLEVIDYNVAKTKYGNFDNWKYVKPGAFPAMDNTSQIQKSIFDNTWRLSELKKEQVEIVRYQDQINNEFQVIINGVLMMPIGFPLSAVSARGKFSITQQNLRPINGKFALGKSFVSSGAVKEVSKLIDEMLKLFVLKTRKSVTPPYVNVSGKVISRRVLSPGKISMGFTADVLQKIGEEGNGVTSSEYQILEKLQDTIDKSTISNQFQGQQGKSGTTATEVNELQRQAKLTLGLVVTACTLLEKKLAYLRLFNLLENWFNPTDTRVETFDDVQREVNQYRTTNRKAHIPNQGMGERHVIPMDGQLPNPDDIYAHEQAESALKGKPIKKVFVSVEALRNCKLVFYIAITAKEKKTSNFYKLMFRDKLNDLITMLQFGTQINTSELEDEFARVWDVNGSKLFAKGGPGAPGGSPDGADAEAPGGPVKMPSKITAPIPVSPAVG